MLGPDSVVVRSGDLVSAPMGDEMAMMDMVSGSYFVLDKVAAAIWDSLETPIAVRELCEQLRERFDVAAERCQSDVLPFLETLALKNLVRVAGGDR